MDHLKDTLSNAGFFHDEIYERLKEERHAEFACAATREAVHAGSAYPDEPDPLRLTLSRYMAESRQAVEDGIIGIAAPHVSPEGGWKSYSGAYGSLGDHHKDRTFVILGTSHYGAPDRFGLTRKAFTTPLERRARTRLLWTGLPPKPPAPSKWKTTATRQSTPSNFRSSFFSIYSAATLKSFPFFAVLMGGAFTKIGPPRIMSQ